jgi:Ni2+-binding GTPase involved in maturation of urease and hydrogenase
MKLHIVGGFLGSGKTTAILSAARELMTRSLKVGIITNDQGHYLVDTAFFRMSDLPAVEVTGGCFCCNYDDLDGHLDELISQAHPNVIFAESVGSCADLVATVVQPLLALRVGQEPPASFTVFTDSRLLRLRLLGEDMPFSDDVVYIFDKQIEEACLLVINKIDLLSTDRLAELRRLAAERYPAKNLLFQNSIAAGGVQDWLTRLDNQPLFLPETSLEIDYQRYGAGETRLAWLNEQISLFAPHGIPDIVRVITALVTAIRSQGVDAGHLKFLIQAGETQVKLSIPNLEEPNWYSGLPPLPAGSVHLLINARLEMDAESLRLLVEEILNDSSLTWQLESIDAFHPTLPNPTHRMTTVNKGL